MGIVRPEVSGLRLMTGISIYWVGLSALADGLTTLVLPYQVDAVVDGSRRATALGVVTFLGLMLAMFVQPVAGFASDRLRHRLGRRGWIGLGTIAILLALALAGLAATTSLLAVVAAYLAVQVTISIAQAGQQGLIPDLVSTELRGVAAGWKGLSDVGGATLGFVVLGNLLESGGVTAALLVAGVLLAATYAVMLLLVDERLRRSEPRSGSTSTASFASAYRIVLPRDAAFVRLVMARFSFLLGIFGVGRFFLFFVEDRLGLGAAEAGAMLGVLAVVTVVASPLAGWLADRYGRLPIMRVGVVLAVVGVGSLIPAGSTTLVLLAGGFMALGSAAFGAANWAATTDVVTDGETARLMGLANFGTAGAAAAAGLLGPLIDATEGVASGAGYNLLFVTAIVFMAASALTVHRIGETEPGRITV